MILVLNSVRSHTDGGNKLFFDLVERSGIEHEVIVIAEEDWGLIGNFLVALCQNRWVLYAKRRRVAFPVFALLYYRLLRPILTRRLIRRFRGRGLTGVWTQSNDILPLLGAQVASAIGCALHVSVQDLPFTFVMAPAERRYLASAMPDWLRVTTSCDVQTPAMERMLTTMAPGERLNLVLWSSAGLLADPKNDASLAPSPLGKTLRIAYCGGLRFARELRAFVKAMELLRERGMDVELRLFTTRPISSPVVVWEGYVRDEVDLVKRLARADAALSQLSFAATDRVMIETSFPGKIGTYLAAGLPIIALGPPTASNVEFVRACGVGVGITSPEPEVIAAALEDFGRDHDAKVRYQERIPQILGTLFGEASRRQFFASAFGSSVKSKSNRQLQTPPGTSSNSLVTGDQTLQSAKVR